VTDEEITAVVNDPGLNAKSVRLILHVGLQGPGWHIVRRATLAWMGVGASDYGIHRAIAAAAHGGFLAYGGWARESAHLLYVYPPAPERCRATTGNWRFRSRTIQPEIRRFVFERDGNRCVRCGSTRRLTADHIIPFSKDGEHTIENLRTLCQTCNSSRGAREDW
jgi:hypothetical protein